MLFLLLVVSSLALSQPASPPVQEDGAPATTLAPEDKSTAKPGVVELLDIAGADIQRAVFHQKHTVPDGTVIGTYGYFDSKEKYHVLNYVNDEIGLRVISDYTPFDPLPGTVTAAAQASSNAQVSSSTNKVEKPEDDDFDDEQAESSVTIETKETRETHVLNNKPKVPSKKPEAETLETSDGDNLLRDEHSIIRTHALPPPGHPFLNGYYGHHNGGFQGLDSAVFPQTPLLPFRTNVSRRYYNGLYYGAQGNGLGFHSQSAGVAPGRRIPLPYENPLYPLLYGDQGKLAVQSETERGDDINDTSGLDASDVNKEVPSNPGKVHAASQTGHTQEAGGNFVGTGHFGEAGQLAVGQIAGTGLIGTAGHLAGGHIGAGGGGGGASGHFNYGVLAPPTTIHHGYAGSHYNGAHGGYHQGYYPGQQVAAYYQHGYYPPAQGAAYVGHHQAGYQTNARYYAPQTGGYAQSQRYYYRYPSQHYEYSHNYQG